jgi:hypothetical protein
MTQYTFARSQRNGQGRAQLYAGITPESGKNTPGKPSAALSGRRFRKISIAACAQRSVLPQGQRLIQTFFVKNSKIYRMNPWLLHSLNGKTIAN